MGGNAVRPPVESPNHPPSIFHDPSYVVGGNDSSGGFGGNHDPPSTLQRRQPRRTGSADGDDVVRSVRRGRPRPRALEEALAQLSRVILGALRVLLFSMSIVENVIAARRRITAAAHGVGRDPGDVTLMAVSKTFSCRPYSRGVRSRASSFWRKSGPGIHWKSRLRHWQEAEWHMIGHLQSNKAAAAAEAFTAVDSLDSLRLAEELNASAEKMGRKLEVLIESMWAAKPQRAAWLQTQASWRNSWRLLRDSIISNSAG